MCLRLATLAAASSLCRCRTGNIEATLRIDDELACWLDRHHGASDRLICPTEGKTGIIRLNDIAIFGLIYRYHSDMARKIWPSEASILAGGGVALITYLGFGITIWAIDPNYYIEAIYILSVAVGTLIYRDFRLSRQIIGLRAELASVKNTIAATSDLGELAHIDGLARGLVGLMVHLTQPPYTDDRHHLSFVREEYVVHGDDGTYNWTLSGQNASDSVSQSIYVKISGDSPIDLTELPVTVIDRLHGDAQLRFSCIGDRPNCKAFSIDFVQPLSPGDAFELQLSCRWDNTFLRTHTRDYVFFSWGAFAALGIDRFIGRLVCDTPVTDFVLERFDDGQRLREPRQPRVVDTSDRHTVLEWEVLNPTSIYVLSFTKVLSGRR